MLRLLPWGIVFLGCAGPTKIVMPMQPQASEMAAPQTSEDASVERHRETPEPTSERVGAMTYLAGGVLFQLDAKPGAKAVNLGHKLDAHGMGQDQYVAVSKNGEHMALSTTRFHKDCQGWACLAVLTGNAEEPSHVHVKGQAMHPEGRASISNDGALIVFTAGDGPHIRDLYALDRQDDGTWQGPRLLTERSNHEYNTVPALSDDGSSLLFDCGSVPYSQEGTGICEVSSDAVVFRQRVDPKNNPDGSSGEFCAHHADYLSDGSIVFEADWSGQQLWLLEAEATTPHRVNAQFSNDNRPCGLAGGYIASLWYDRPGSNGTGELKIMQPDGPDFEVLTPSQDVTTLACHSAAK